jgi:hypothetical protein
MVGDIRRDNIVTLCEPHRISISLRIEDERAIALKIIMMNR